MENNLDQIRDEFIESTARLGDRLGLSRVSVQLYILLYLSDKPLSLDDMVKILKISKGTASIKIRALEDIDAVRKVWIKGSRRDFYEAEMDTLKVFVSRIKSIVKNRMEEAKDILSHADDLLRDSVDALDGEEKKKALAYKKKLEETKKMHAKVNAIIKGLSLFRM